MMGITSITLTGLVLLAVPVVLVPIGVLGRKVRRLARISQDKVADLGATLMNPCTKSELFRHITMSNPISATLTGGLSL